jgi:hypothetical protein
MFNKPNFEKAYDFSQDSIGKIYITGGGFVEREFQGIGRDSSFGWRELVWKKSPTRSAGNFAFTNMDTIDIGLIARCEVVIPYANYDDYMAMRKILGRERHFKVRFFDMDDAKWVTRDMYCTENNKSKFFMMDRHIVGARDITIKLVGTNLDLKTVVEKGVEKYVLNTYTVKYNESGKATSKSVTEGDQFVMKSSTTEAAPSGKRLAGWIDKDGDNIIGYYTTNQSTTVWKNLNLYPWWK